MIDTYFKTKSISLSLDQGLTSSSSFFKAEWSKDKMEQFIYIFLRFRWFKFGNSYVIYKIRFIYNNI